MKEDLHLKNGIVIPAHELEMTTSRSSGPGGQNVNKTNSRVSIRWNLTHSHALTEEQKERLMAKIPSHITHHGDIIIHSSESRSQDQNRHAALKHLADLIVQGLFVPKIRMKTREPRGAKEARVEEKKHKGEIKRMRQHKWD
jgi:ribosome-associated protein